ncbi:hypothetical protein F4824DRAFT_286169 [Ustulina deusta]|nr:hypothetical protein F4824DRAFT_286169 [Ustulina deusta]
MSEPDVADISLFVDFGGDGDNGESARNDFVPTEPFWMDLDPPGDQVPGLGIIWNSPGIFNAPFEFKADPFESSQRTDLLSNQHVSTGENAMPMLESSMDIDLDFGFDFSLDVSAALAQVNDHSEPPSFESPLDNEGRFDDGIVINGVSKETRPRLDQTQVDTLNEWVAGCSTPYPTKKEKLSLSKRTGLKISQISSWFSRVRQKRFRGAHPEPAQPVHVAVPSPMRNMEVPWLVSDKRNYRGSKSSMPIALSKTIPFSATIQRSRSLPSYFTLDYLQRRTGHPVTDWHQRASLDVFLSSNTDKCSSHGQKGVVGSLGLREYPKQSYMNEWLRGLPIGATEMVPVQQDEIHSESVGYPRTEALGRVPNIIPESLQPNTPNVNLQQNCDRNGAEDGQDSASIAWSAGLSGSSAGSYLSLGSRKGRRIFAHPRSSGESGSIRKRGLDTEARDVTFTNKKPRPTSPLAQSSLDEHQSKKTKYGEKFYCTSCDSRFATSYLWRRHEESAHAPQQVWICGPQSTLGNTATDLPTPPCPICEQILRSDIATDDLEAPNTCSHGFDECWAKSEADRTFFRKDTLYQHIVRVHKRSSEHSKFVQQLQLDYWSPEVDTSGYDLTCHFCGASNSNWFSRVRHISNHFGEGVTMDEWRPRYNIDYNQPEPLTSSMSPPLEDMEHTDQNLRPYKVPRRFEGDMYMPQWHRISDGNIHGWCELCQPGRWLHIGSVAFKHDRSILHGISSLTGNSFPQPIKVRWGITHGIEGLCARCNDWIVLKRNTFGEESWFTHSQKCELETIP